MLDLNEATRTLARRGRVMLEAPKDFLNRYRDPVPKKQQHAHPATRTGGALELPFRAALPATKCAGQAGREPGIRTAVKAAFTRFYRLSMLFM